MEKKAIVIVGALALVAALTVYSGVAYATVGPLSGQGTYNHGMAGRHGYGGSMMGGTTGYSGMMGDNNGSNWSCSCTGHCPGSSFLP